MEVEINHNKSFTLGHVNRRLIKITIKISAVTEQNVVQRGVESHFYSKWGCQAGVASKNIAKIDAFNT